MIKEAKSDIDSFEAVMMREDRQKSSIIGHGTFILLLVKGGKDDAWAGTFYFTRDNALEAIKYVIENEMCGLET